MSQLIIFGDRTAAEMAAVAKEICGNRFDKIETRFVNPELPSADSVPGVGSDTWYMIGVIETLLRRSIEKSCIARGYKPFTLIHPSAYVAETSKIGEGCFIAPHAAIAINAVVGDHAIVHFHASVGHDAVIGRHCALLPGARVSGKVKVGNSVLIGSNAFIYQGVEIGDEAHVDALTYVKENVPPRRVVSVRRGNGADNSPENI